MILIPESKRVAPEAIEFLNIVQICQEFHTLPDQGGLLDQDSLFIHLLGWVLTFSEEKRKLEEHKAKSKSRS